MIPARQRPALLVALILAACSAAPTAIPTAGPPSTPDPTATTFLQSNRQPRTGDEGFIRVQSPAVFGATSEDNNAALNRAIVANDQIGVFDLVAQGKAYLIDNGTRVLVLGRGGFFSALIHIRILEGQYLGLALWMPFEFIHTSPPESSAQQPTALQGSLHATSTPPQLGAASGSTRRVSLYRSYLLGPADLPVGFEPDLDLPSVVPTRPPIDGWWRTYKRLGPGLTNIGVAIDVYGSAGVAHEAINALSIVGGRRELPPESVVGDESYLKVTPYQGGVFMLVYYRLGEIVGTVSIEGSTETATQELIVDLAKRQAQRLMAR